MPYSDYVNGLIKSQSTISAGSEIQKTTAIQSITTSTQFTATLLLNTAVIVFTDPAIGTVTFPSKTNISDALSLNNYSLTNGIILDFVLVNTTNSNITLNYNNLEHPNLELNTTILAANQVNSYKIISNIPNNGVPTFIIYLISGGGEVGADSGDNPNITTTDRTTSLGIDALKNIENGIFNTAVGYKALQDNINGSKNTAIGHQALASCIGIDNTAVGASTNVVSGNANTLVGYNANALSYNNCVLLGANATASRDNQLSIQTGNLSVGTVIATHTWRVRINDVDYYIPLSSVGV